MFKFDMEMMSLGVNFAALCVGVPLFICVALGLDLWWSLGVLAVLAFVELWATFFRLKKNFQRSGPDFDLYIRGYWATGAGRLLGILWLGLLYLSVRSSDSEYLSVEPVLVVVLYVSSGLVYASLSSQRG